MPPAYRDACRHIHCDGDVCGIELEMRLTSKEELRRGVWFVRRITGEQDLGRGPWTIAVIGGDFPFLFGRTYIYAEDLENTNMDRILRRENYDIYNPNEWEFGSRIEFPSEEVDEQ